MVPFPRKHFGFSLFYALSFLISGSIILGIFLKNPMFALAFTPFLFGSLGFLWNQPDPRRLYIGILSSLFWTALYSFFANGVLVLISHSVYGFGDHPIRTESEILRLEKENYLLQCQAVSVACVVAWIAGYIGGEATKKPGLK